jgi:GNAT superfamily N-acetyltransferase
VASEPNENNDKRHQLQIGLKDVLTFLDMAMEEHPGVPLPLSADEIFAELTALLNKTVRGTRIKRFRPAKGTRLFHGFEIHSEEGEVLGSLNMIHLRKPITSYYLVYVDVLPPFRGQGLGNRILKAFKEFAEASGAIGLLENIIPPEDPTYALYANLGWIPIEELIGHEVVGAEGHYMVYVPESVTIPDLRERLNKLFIEIRKKRAVIDIQHNDAMVKEAIKEFRSVYEFLRHLFQKELASGKSTPFMSFMFTRFIRKVLGFHRRIATLLGYTGGESLGQISISDQIKDLPFLPYSLWSPHERQVEIWEEVVTVRNLPEKVFKEPTFFVEDLPLYRRPYLLSWIEKRRIERSRRMKISDMIELGFDPTRLREFHHEGKAYIFERISPNLLPSVEKIRNFLRRISSSISETRFHNTAAFVNPPLAIFQDRGNAYILRQKVGGIHLEEALEQLRTSPALREMNQTIGIDRVLIVTVNEVNKWLLKTFGPRVSRDIEDLTFFVSWDLEKNRPKVMVDEAGIFFDSLWIV